MKPLRELIVPLVVGAVIVIAIWLASLAAVVLLADRIAVENLPAYGAVGDMFGAVAALFGGLGLVGLATVLFFDIRVRERDLEDRQREIRPYVMPRIDDGSVYVSSSRWNGEALELQVLAEVELENATADLAMNVDVESGLSLGAHNTKGILVAPDLPLQSESTIAVSIRFNFSDGAAKDILAKLSQGERAKQRIVVKYSGLNGKKWTSEVEFDVSTSRGDDQAMLKALGDRSRSEEIHASSTAEFASEKGRFGSWWGATG